MGARALSTTAGGAKGSYLVPTDTLPAAAPVWPTSTIEAAGVRRIEGLAGNCVIPRYDSSITVSWQAGDAQSPGATDPSIGAVSVTAKTLFCTAQVTKQLVQQGGAAAENELLRVLLRKLLAAQDQALLQGTGASGQPIGLSALPTPSGITQISGTSATWATILSAQKTASAAGVPDGNMVWVGAPTVRETLSQREKAAGGGQFLWSDNGIAGQRAISTPDSPSATLFCGDFSQAVLATFGPGIELRYDPANDWNAGKVAWQVLCVCDIVVVQPSAFVRISSIT
jgi:HK97 family phage major capsid protein